jgi:hypothetical protein
MPRATCKYRFEWKVFDWAKNFSEILTGHDQYAFFIAFTETGRARKVIVGDRPETFDRQELEALQGESPSWLFHDPFEGPVYTYIQWQNVERRTMERLLGASFEPNDFMSNDKSVEFPTSWGVMF